MMDKSWVHLNRVTDEYLVGASNFIKIVAKNLGYPHKMLCPCKNCRNLSHQEMSIVYEHIVINGVDPTYTIWFHHGEDIIEDETDESLNDGEAYNLYTAAYRHDENFEESAQPALDDEWKQQVNDANSHLYDGCTKYTKLSSIVALYKLKTMHSWSDTSFNGLLELISDMLPSPNVLLKSMYETKKYLKKFDLQYEKIDTCVNDCCLFMKENKKLENCPNCGASRWKVDERTNRVKKGVSAKVLRYFPIIPRFRRMFRSQKTAEELRWHFKNKSEDGKMHHLVDSAAWDLVSDKWPIFASDPRSLRLGLSTDGFNPFGMISTQYSCWPVMLVIYNFPPWSCMRKENVMLSLLIPGPKQPGKDIDIYLQPLVDDLKMLWDGVSAYDAYDNENFKLRALLLWTINDFPAYGNLAGCTTKGKHACPICAHNTKSVWLRHSRKFSYMGHRRFLPPSHSFRRKKLWFNGKEEKDPKPRVMTGRRIVEELKNFVNDWGKSVKKRKRGEGKAKRDADSQQIWRKRSIFFDLPYWEELSLRHNLDVMHIEKNVCESLLNTLLNLLPTALRGLLPQGPRTAIMRLSVFFNRLCQRKIDSKELMELEEEVVETLCLLERWFPPSFFDIMVHLVTHIGREARLCGPVQFRWMYPFERYMMTLKRYVRNRSRPEGCIAMRYIADECVQFCSGLIKETIDVYQRQERNDEDVASNSILEGRPISKIILYFLFLCNVTLYLFSYNIRHFNYLCIVYIYVLSLTHTYSIFFLFHGKGTTFSVTWEKFGEHQNVEWWSELKKLNLNKRG
ncbi:hypothetical protein UlMin_016959 [Ulmus minor]